MHLQQAGPMNDFCNRLHGEKYRLGGGDEVFREAINRSSGALADNPKHFRQLTGITMPMRFMYAGRIQAAVGAPHQITPFNCYASGEFHDSFAGIMQRASETAQTMRMGGGIGHDISPLRPKGELIKGVNSRTDGPLAFLPIFDAVSGATSSAGQRRGAQMGMLRIDHPDIEAYIRLKQRLGYLEGFNLSVAVTDEFMHCLLEGKPFDLRWGRKVYETIDPRALWETLMRSTWDWGDPGVFFVDTVNRLNNLWYCETIATTNPCGEQPLPPHGACLLGSYNLVKYLVKDGIGPHGYSFDWEQFRADIPPIVRAMDNVIDQANFPLPEQEKEAKNKRRMGLGATAFANAGEALGHEYGSPGFLGFERKVLTTLRDEAYMASSRLAAEKGSFPLFDAELYLQGENAQRLPEYIQDHIRIHGIRNSHLTSIAPTGTISICADNVSSGIEPVFAYDGERPIRMNAGTEIVNLADYGYAHLGVRGKLAANVTAKEHIDVLTMASQLVDSAVSKTCNVNNTMPWEDFTDLYVQAWKNGCKGCTTFNSDGKKMGLLMTKNESPDETGPACVIDLETGARDCG